MHNKPVALVPGANKGIGLQIAKDLVAQGFTALVGSRKLESGETAAKRVGADARALQLDVANQASIAAAAERVRNEFGRLDVLVNNAGISHAGNSGKSLEDIVKWGRTNVGSLDDVPERGRVKGRLRPGVGAEHRTVRVCRVRIPCQRTRH